VKKLQWEKEPPSSQANDDATIWIDSEYAMEEDNSSLLLYQKINSRKVTKRTGRIISYMNIIIITSNSNIAIHLNVHHKFS